MRPRLLPILAGVSASLLLMGCGLAETASTAATGGVAKAKELEQAKATQQRVLQQIDQSMRDGTARLEKAESAQSQ
jgi:hypothetical protein